MKRHIIVGCILGIFGLFILAFEINCIIDYFESFHSRSTANAAIYNAPVVHAPPEIKSSNGKEWEEINSYILSRNRKVYPKLAAEITDYILEYSEKYSIKSAIVVSVMDVESTYNYSVVSDKEAIGLMQVVYKYWKDDQDIKEFIKQEKDLFDPELNIRAGCLILSKLKKQHKDIKKYLNAYYGEPGYFEKVSVAFSRFKLSTGYN